MFNRYILHLHTWVSSFSLLHFYGRHGRFQSAKSTRRPNVQRWRRFINHLQIGSTTLGVEELRQCKRAFEPLCGPFDDKDLGTLMMWEINSEEHTWHIDN